MQSVALLWFVAALARPDSPPSYGVFVGGDVRGARAGFRIAAPIASRRLRVHWDLSLVTTGGPGRPALWHPELDRGAMLVQPMVGFGADLTVAGPVYLAGAIRTDVLAPVRGLREVSRGPTGDDPWWEAALAWPVVTARLAATWGQIKVTLGVRPSPRWAVEAGVWPTNAYVWNALFVPRQVRGIDTGTALRPGGQIILWF